MHRFVIGHKVEKYFAMRVHNGSFRVDQPLEPDTYLGNERSWGSTLVLGLECSGVPYGEYCPLAIHPFFFDRMSATHSGKWMVSNVTGPLKNLQTSSLCDKGEATA